MKTGIIAITRGGKTLAKRLERLLPGSTHLTRQENQKVSELIRESWGDFEGLVCIMASGIVVRSIAPLLKDKASDPCVIVIDERGSHVISLLSGHLGGGNELTLKIAQLIGATPVITTASDTLDLVALDLWAKTNNLVAPVRKKLTALSARLVNERSLKIYADIGIGIASLPNGLVKTEDPLLADLVVSNRLGFSSDQSVFRPRNLIVGTGCNRGTPEIEFEEALDELFSDLQLSRKSVRNLASIDKKNDETGLLQFASSNNWSIDFFDNTTINEIKNLEISFAALKAVGAIGVAEPTSLLSAKSNLLICRKRKWKNITMAVAQAACTLSEQGLAQ